VRAVLGEVADVEFDPSALVAVAEGEVVPGEVSPCIGVDAEEEVVLIGADLDRAVQVAALEPGLEGEVLVDGGVHAFEGAVVELVAVELVVRHRVLSGGGGTLMELLLRAAFDSVKA
jgi:hypothetical protein